MSTDYFPDREVKMSKFFNKKEELKSHGITVEEIDKRYRLKLDVPDNVSSFDIFKECFDETDGYKKMTKSFKETFGDEGTPEVLFETLKEMYKKEVWDRGFEDCHDWMMDRFKTSPEFDEKKPFSGRGKFVTEDKMVNLIFSMFVPLDSKKKSNYMWLYNGHRNKDIIGGVCRYGRNTDQYLVKILEKVLGFKLIDEYSYHHEEMVS
jgi:hypothetical protein